MRVHFVPNHHFAYKIFSACCSVWMLRIQIGLIGRFNSVLKLCVTLFLGGCQLVQWFLFISNFSDNIKKCQVNYDFYMFFKNTVESIKTLLIIFVGIPSAPFRHTLAIFWAYFQSSVGHLLGIFWASFGHLLGIFWASVGHLLGIF